ncbi:MAG: hypothetical protein LBL96_04495 [Clostridiales bacterium]|jgi:hypothetical protein|nr:hypothetical protein [Clostridiales bacterium]
MNIQYYISALAFVLFVACVAGRAAMLRRKGVKAIVFAATEKTDFLHHSELQGGCVPES